MSDNIAIHMDKNIPLWPSLPHLLHRIGRLRILVLGTVEEVEALARFEGLSGMGKLIAEGGGGVRRDGTLSSVKMVEGCVSLMMAMIRGPRSFDRFHFVTS